MKEPEKLPVWNLSKFYTGIADPAIEETKTVLRNTVIEMNQQRHALPKFKDFELLAFIRKYEQIVEKSHDLMNFASLNLCTQRDNNEAKIFEKRTEEFVGNIFEQISWVHEAIYALPIEKKYEFLQSQKFKDYSEWLQYNLLLAPSLSEAVRKAVYKFSTITNGWNDLYKQLTSNLKFVIGKKGYTLDEISDMAHCEPNKDKRDRALKVMSEEFKKHGYLFTQTINSILKNEDVVTEIHLSREDDEPIEYDALDLDAFGNGLDRETILSVATATTDSYVAISQRFYKLLAKLQGKEKIDYNDRLQNPIVVKEKQYSFKDCLQIVLETIGAFSFDLAVTGANIINSELIHAQPMKGKDTGAFCIRGKYPYIFLNYRGNQSSVLTFAHEFGHAIHHLYSHQSSGELNDSTPISMAEVASLFSEKLLFSRFMGEENLSNKERLHLLIEDVSRQIADIHRQIAFSKFELRAFRERQKGEVSEERFTQIYCEEMERYLGFPLQEDAKFGWMAIPHLFNSPFYVRYYAFAGMVVNKLWQAYASGAVEDFAMKYEDMLYNTGFESIDDLLAPFGLNIYAPGFWESALDPISAEIDEIERLAKAEGLL